MSDFGFGTGKFFENVAFRGNTDSVLNNADPSLGAARVRAALDSVNLSDLSTSEKNTIQSLLDVLGADGYISGSDADMLVGLIDGAADSGQFVDTLLGGNSGNLSASMGANLAGSIAFSAASSFLPFTAASLLGGFGGSAVFGGLLGALVDKLVQTFQDALFTGGAKGMLESCRQGGEIGILKLIQGPKSNNDRNIERIERAIDNADLSKLNPRERAKALAMIGFASADGHISRVEANAICDYLDRAQGHAAKSAGGDWSVQQQGGQAHIDLGNYTLDLSEGNSQFVLTNKSTGEVTRVWGDPHFEQDGREVGTFKGTMTLNLDDGTKLTINTVPFGNGQTLASTLTITNGNQAIVVTGLDQNTLGDLKVSRSPIGGQLFDAIVDDGTNIYENPEGAGWLELNSGGWLQAVDGQFLSSVD